MEPQKPYVAWMVPRTHKKYLLTELKSNGDTLVTKAKEVLDPLSPLQLIEVGTEPGYVLGYTPILGVGLMAEKYDSFVKSFFAIVVPNRKEKLNKYNWRMHSSKWEKNYFEPRLPESLGNMAADLVSEIRGLEDAVQFLEERCEENL